MRYPAPAPKLGPFTERATKRREPRDAEPRSGPDDSLGMAEPDVLIAGAGPTGLVLAIWLRRLGVRFRIIDKAERPATNSRALAIQARTLEFYRQLGLADKIVEAGFQFAAVNLWASGRGGAAA